MCLNAITTTLNSYPRILILLLTILSLINPASAFEKEDEQLFSVENPEQTLRILSSTDLNYFVPLISAYQRVYEDTAVLYTVASSAEVFKAIHDEKTGNQGDSTAYDLVISSAMDLQVKLANDGFARPYRSVETDSLPSWASWQNSLFAFTQEPAVLIASQKRLAALSVPDNRQDLITLLRDNPDYFKGKIGTYDLRISGAGYLFATQDVRQSDAFWRLAEVMGALSPKLYCCSSDMIEDLESGKILMAYNVMGSYAAAALKPEADDKVITLTDYTHFLLRTAFIPVTSEQPEAAGTFIDFLIGSGGRELIKQKAGLPPIDGEALAKDLHLRPIRLGPELLVYLDKIKRKRFLDEWTDAMVQPR